MKRCTLTWSLINLSKLLLHVSHGIPNNWDLHTSNSIRT